jgi:hypothetical protein
MRDTDDNNWRSLLLHFYRRVGQRALQVGNAEEKSKRSKELFKYYGAQVLVYTTGLVMDCTKEGYVPSAKEDIHL